LLVLLPLLTALLAALEIPLAQSYADGLTQELVRTRKVDAERFAALAEPILRTDVGVAPLLDDLRRYPETHPGATATIFDQDADVWLALPGRRASARARAATETSLAGDVAPEPPTAWPWRSTPMVVTAPVGRRVPIGAVVLEVSTARVRQRVEARMAVLAAGGVAVLLLTSALCAGPLARWLLRPVSELNAAVGRLAGGDLSARAAERGGPPELRGLARAFNQMADSLASAMERQRAFVFDASHELRNPLATLRLRMEALGGKVRDGGDRDLRLALAESDRLAHTVQRLLELARAEATAAEQVDADVVSLTTTRVEAWRARLQASGSELALDAPARAIARCSPEAVEYALDVVLENACAFAPGAPVDVTIAVRDGHIDIVVRDHGPGLTGAERAHAGERFWRSPRHRAVPGTGLGLATARALLEATGGALDLLPAAPGLAIRLRLLSATGSLPDTSASRPGAG